ncbi:hypothetical protein [Sphingomonas sp. CV7422]|uniref:hypothetical protein n=1 Tax=Sphingomonas sp. CV7422 TaxID=3018036 RepID=UPI0022FEAAD6|nr:hypothetical protein [Sphingomonas sp. CV7422]
MFGRLGSLWSTARGRALVVVPILLVAIWLSFRITAATVFARSNPALALAIDSSNSWAAERQATLISGEATPEAARRAAALAKRALRESPLSAEAAATLGTAETILRPDTPPLAAFQYSQMLTRRLALTQIWFIEYGVSQANIPIALQAYDRLFRTADVYRKQFLPTLLQASAESEVTRGMTKVLATRPPWTGDYFGGLLATFPGPVNFVRLVEAMRFDVQNPDEAGRLALAIGRLIDSGRPDLALHLYARATHVRTASIPLLREGAFERLGRLPPIDWELADNEQLRAELGTNEAGQPALNLVNRGGRVGAFARQLLFLVPGRYRLQYATGGVTGDVADRPKVLLTCFAAGTPLSATSVPTAPSRGRNVMINFSVPAQGCSSQWLVLEAGNPIDTVAGDQWIGNINLVRVNHD